MLLFIVFAVLGIIFGAFGWNVGEWYGVAAGVSMSGMLCLGIFIGRWNMGPPLIDLGHRAYGVADEMTARLITNLIENTTGIGERFTFDSGPTHQTLLNDGTTVIMVLDKELHDAGMTGNALSLVVASPLGTANAVARDLRANGFTAEAVPQTEMGFSLNDGEPLLVVVRSNAFKHWELVFRRHSFAMGGMPKMRRIT